MRSALARMVPGKKQKWLCLADRPFPNLRTIEDVNRSYVRSETKGSPKRGFGAKGKVRAAAGHARSRIIITVATLHRIQGRGKSCERTRKKFRKCSASSKPAEWTDGASFSRSVF